MLFINKISLFLCFSSGEGFMSFDIVTACRCPFGREVATSAVLQMN